MRTITKKFLSLALAFSMALALVPAFLLTASATVTADYTLYLDDSSGKLYKNTSSGAEVTTVMAGEGAVVNGTAGARVLTLTDFNYLTSANVALRVTGTTTIVLNGTNIIGGGSSSTYANGIEASNLTIKGDGSLTVIAGETTANNSRGIFATSITINERATVKSIGGKVNTSGESSGIHCSSGSLEISDNATVTAIGGDAPTASAIYVYNNTTISGNATVTATSTMVATTIGYGFYTPNNPISISENANVTAIGNSSALNKAIIIPTGFKYYISTDINPSTIAHTGNGTTSNINIWQKYAKIMENILPTLSAWSVNRTSDTAATIGFITNEVGAAYYLVKNSGDSLPTKTAVKAGTSLGAVTVGANVGKAVTLTVGAKDIYVVVEDAASNISEPLKIVVPAYVKPPTPKLPFTDVKPTDWFYDDVAYVYNKKIADGTSTTTYSPNSSLTRAAFITFMWRVHGSPKTSGLPFKDVKKGQYYTQAVAWGKKNGIIDGTTKTTFAPKAKLTRQAMATLIYRYEKKFGKYPPNKTQAVAYNKITDRNTAASYAKASLEKCYNQGMLRLATGDKIRPKANATRAEMARVLHYLMVGIGK